MSSDEHVTAQPQISVVLGGIGTACWCIQILPQIWKNWRRHTTTGVPSHMLLLWASAMPFFGAYCILRENNLAIQAQPQIFCSLCLLCWSQTLYYAKKYKPWQAILTALATGAGFAALELALVLGIRIPYNKGVQWPLTALGAWACALLNLGLIVPFYQAYKDGWRFIGLSFRFVAIDFAGALFSLVSLATQHKWDKFGGASYIIVMILEIGLVVVQLSWIWRNRDTIRTARAAGKTYDEYVAAKEQKQKIHDEEAVESARTSSDGNKTNEDHVEDCCARKHASVAAETK
ncbi:uncharacterized protein PV09_04260 [Verruconis gallopava]|uniref:PQ loop repeat protein n=1 Tax=Verruconis gallopava TaxID=253628 RepID=A0A0D2AZJ6_9PEZI|nr:uncharacterized protein PV09_04260 [Verruconis gallopava]KIW04504.1 hypothetical protein PV09_04260 [Verruconis gallopava]